MIANIDPVAAAPVALRDIEPAAMAYGIAHADLGDTVRELEAELTKVCAKYIGRIRREVAKAAEKRSELQALVERGAHLFESPRTLVVAGIRVGFRKGAGAIDWADDAKVCALIRKHFPKAQADLLIKTTEKPITKALADLDVAELRRLGCTIEATGDVVVIKPADSEVEKIVAALLRDATEGTEG